LFFLFTGCFSAPFLKGRAAIEFGVYFEVVGWETLCYPVFHFFLLFLGFGYCLYFAVVIFQIGSVWLCAAAQEYYAGAYFSADCLELLGLGDGAWLETIYHEGQLGIQLIYFQLGGARALICYHTTSHLAGVVCAVFTYCFREGELTGYYL
jgi:hypothetical protein